jgi:hypothetical protein
VDKDAAGLGGGGGSADGSAGDADATVEPKERDDVVGGRIC